MIGWLGEERAGSDEKKQGIKMKNSKTERERKKWEERYGSFCAVSRLVFEEQDRGMWGDGIAVRSDYLIIVGINDFLVRRLSQGYGGWTSKRDW